MADKVCEKPQEQIKEKAVVEEKKEEEVVKETTEKKVENEENGDVEDAPKNGKEDSKDGADADVDHKEEEQPVSCPVKRKSAGGGGDAPEGSSAEEATPEKKAKLSAAESTDKPEVAA